ncbi:MAG: hypothetical protein JWM90_2787 [Thermoleophilia bacterium]|nr:hypothetical protein [Thermoleophilia bacterium]
MPDPRDPNRDLDATRDPFLEPAAPTRDSADVSESVERAEAGVNPDVELQPSDAPAESDTAPRESPDLPVERSGALPRWR